MSENSEEEIKDEKDHTAVKEEEDEYEVGNGHEFMETVLVELKEERNDKNVLACDQCEFTTKDRSNLGIHKRSVHKELIVNVRNVTL